MPEVSIFVVSGPNEGKEFELSGSTTIGRDSSAGIVIDDPEASRRHASLSVEGDTITVEDLGSTNGTFVNGQRISAAQTLTASDKLRIGTTVFGVRAEEEPEVQATRVGTALPDLDELQVTAPRNVPDFAKEEEPPAAAPAPPEPEPAPAPTAGPPPTNAPPPSSGPPGGAGGPPGGVPDPVASSPPPPPGGAPPPPAPPPLAAPQQPPAFGGPPPPPPQGGPPATYGGGPPAPGSYPAELDVDFPQNGIARWRPLVQWILAIPQFFVLAFVGFAAYFAFIGVWFSILFTRKYPPGLFKFMSGVVRWANRVNGFNWVMTEQYPPFSLEDEPQYPVRTRIQYPEAGISRWRVFFQGFLAIPHFIVLYLLGIGAYFAFIYAWFVILFTGKYPEGVFNFIVGVMRWQTRVFAYALLMTEEYPPFELA